MSRLFISVGFASKKGFAAPSLVYLGRSGAEQLAAESNSTLPHLLRFNHAIGIPKNNSKAAANAATRSIPAIVPPPSPEQGEPSPAPSPETAAQTAEASKPGGRRRS